MVFRSASLVLACLATWPPSAALAKSNDERRTEIRKRMEDYRAKLEAQIQRGLDQEAASFLSKRRAAIQRAAELIAGKALSLESAKWESPDDVKKDPELIQFIMQQVHTLTDEDALRRDLVAFAQAQEEGTRALMIDAFTKVIEEDLGRVFDESLRGRVVQAVGTIPIDELVQANADTFEKHILAAMPVSELSDLQKRAVSELAGKLALIAGASLAVTLGLPTESDKFGTVASWIAKWLAGRAVTYADIYLTGPPNTAKISESITTDLRRWYALQITTRLRDIMEQFKLEVVDNVRAQALQYNALIAPDR
jgi:hypothetical protein